MNVVIPYDEYIDLIACRMYCDMLDRDGVDNWEWYGESYYEVAQDWCIDAGVPYSHDDYHNFDDVAEAIVAKAIELGNIAVIEEGDDKGNE